MGKPNSSDCLTLDISSGQWERGSFTNGLLGDAVQGIINLEGEGVVAVHSTSILFLATGSKSWVAGPSFVLPAVCGCNISRTSFVTIHMNDTNNIREYVVSQNKFQPEVIDLWPSLLTKRHGPGCGATSYNFVVAGGVSEWDEVLSSVEIFNIQKRSLRQGGHMRLARAYFQIIPVGSKNPRLLAVGGRNSRSTLSTSEWWEEEGDLWQEGPSLSTGRSNFAAVMAPPNLVCPEIEPLTQSCPAHDDSVAICVVSWNGQCVKDSSSRLLPKNLGHTSDNTPAR